MHVLDGKWPERILRRLAKRPMLVVSAASLGLKVGKDAFQLKGGKIDASEFRRRTGSTVGGVGLGAAGSYAGLVAGHFLMPVPMLGAALGGFAGGALGEKLGDRLGRRGVERLESLLGWASPAANDDAAAEAPEAKAEPASPEPAAKPAPPAEPAPSKPEAKAEPASAKAEPAPPKPDPAASDRRDEVPDDPPHQSYNEPPRRRM